MRRRGAMLLEVIMGLALGVVVAGALGAQTISQSQLLRAAQEDARAREALIAAYERLRAGALAPEPRTLESKDGLTVTLERAPLDPRLARDGALVGVVLRVRWRAADGKPRARALTTLVPGGAR